MNTGLGAGAVVPCGVRLRESEHTRHDSGRAQTRRSHTVTEGLEMLHAMFDERTVKLKILIGTAPISISSLFGD